MGHFMYGQALHRSHVFVVCFLLHLLFVLHVHPWLLALPGLLVRVLAVG